MIGTVRPTQLDDWNRFGSLRVYIFRGPGTWNTGEEEEEEEEEEEGKEGGWSGLCFPLSIDLILTGLWGQARHAR